MDFKKLSFSSMLIFALLLVLAFGVVLWKINARADMPNQENVTPMSSNVPDPLPEPVITKASTPEILTEDDPIIQAQLDRDREQQKQTKNLKMKLEQTNLELEQEKALAEINKLRMENGGALKESATDGQKDLPEIKVEYIGGESIKKEAILSIAGVSFQVKERSNPTDNIQVVSISDSSVKVRFGTPVNLTKTFEYTPE